MRIIIGGLFMLIGICDLFAVNVPLVEAMIKIAIGYLLVDK